MKSPNIGPNLRFLRKRMGLSQEGLAEMLDLNRGNIASYERGSAEPSASVLVRVSRLFKVDLDTLIEQELSSSALSPESERSSSQPAGVRVEAELNRTGRLLPYQDLSEFANLDAWVKEMRAILHGFRNYHYFRMRCKAPESPEFMNLANDYERLMDFTEYILNVKEAEAQPVN